MKKCFCDLCGAELNKDNTSLHNISIESGTDRKQSAVKDTCSSCAETIMRCVIDIQAKNNLLK